MNHFSTDTDMEMGRACSTYGGGKKCIQDLGGETGIETIRATRHSREDSMKMGLQEVG